MLPSTDHYIGERLRFDSPSEYIGSVRGFAFTLTGEWEIVDSEPAGLFIIEPRANARVDGNAPDSGFYCYFSEDE